MPLATKIVGGLVAIAMATTLLLPDRQTVPVLGEVRKWTVDAFRTVMGR